MKEETLPQGKEETPPDKPIDRPATEGDASRKEVIIYALGNTESAIANHIPALVQNILIVAAHVNPLLLGLVMGLKTLWDSITDPIMAHISDNTRSRFGRRRPYILFGGVGRVLFLLVFFLFMPSANFVSNDIMEAQKHVRDAIDSLKDGHRSVSKIAAQIGASSKREQEQMLDTLEGKLPPGFIERVGAWFGKTVKDRSSDGVAKAAIADLDTHEPTLQAELEALQKQISPAEEGGPNHPESPGPEVARLRAKADKLRALLEEARLARGQAIATRVAGHYVLGSYSRLQGEPPGSSAQAQAVADALLKAAGLEPLDIFAVEPKPAPKKSKPNNLFQNIGEGFASLLSPENSDQRKLVLYVLVGLFIFTALSTINDVPYYALGIELSPSYDGRTQVVVYRAVMHKVFGLLSPWFLVICFSPFFANAVGGLRALAILACFIGIPTTVLLFFKTRERTRATIKKSGERPNIFKSIFQIAKEPDFLRIFFLYSFIGMTNGIFANFGFFLNIYWVTGSALSGATLGAWVGMLSWVIGFAILPLINWACRRFEKHKVLGFALVWMSVGTAMKWWAMNPEHPEYQFILPFFFSVGIGSIFTVLPTMMADVTDVDELRYGIRREGMFGAVMAFLMKLIAAATPVLAGTLLVASGFEPALESHQSDSTILNMRLMFSLVPASMLLLALLALYKYPLTRERVQSIKESLRKRHEAENGGSEQAPSTTPA